VNKFDECHEWGSGQYSPLPAAWPDRSTKTISCSARRSPYCPLPHSSDSCHCFIDDTGLCGARARTAACDFRPISSPRRRDSLAHLSDRVRRGDVAAFEELFRAMHAPLCEVADSYVQSQAIAEEIVQDLFFAIWMKRDRLPNVDSIEAYLFTAARNRSLHHLRHRAMVRRWTSWAGGRLELVCLAAGRKRQRATDVRAPTLGLGVRVGSGLSLDDGEQTSRPQTSL